MDDFYTLLAYVRRLAVFALRDRKIERIADGLTAIAIIDQKRIDFRDASAGVGLLYHAGQEIGANVGRLFEQAAALATPEMSQVIRSFPARAAGERDIRNLSGYTVVQTKSGPGFVRWGFRPYRPSYPLDRMALALAEMVKGDKYQPPSVTLAADLPPVWLSGVDDKILKSATASIRGVVTLNATHRPDESLDNGHQFLMIFLAEVESEAAASELMRLAQRKQERSNQVSMLEVQQGRLFCLAIGRSVMAGKPSLESQDSMKRFFAGITNALHVQ